MISALWTPDTYMIIQKLLTQGIDQTYPVDFEPMTVRVTMTISDLNATIQILPSKLRLGWKEVGDYQEDESGLIEFSNAVTNLQNSNLLQNLNKGER